METYSPETPLFLASQSFVHTTLLEHRELPDQIFTVNKNKNVFFDGNLITAIPEQFFTIVKSFAEKANSHNLILWAHFPVIGFFNGAPMLGFNTEDGNETILPAFYAPLLETKDDNGSVIQASYSSLTGMNFILFNRESKWLIYMDYRTSIGIFHCESSYLRDMFVETLDRHTESEYLLHNSDIVDIISEIYDQAEMKKFITNYLD